MKPRLNFRLLLGLTAAALLTGTAVAAVHAWQVRGQAASLLAEADRSEESAAPDRAAEYLKRYLTYAPDDVDALERYGRLLERLAQTPADRERALYAYEQALMRDPQRPAVRRTAADLAMKQGAFFRAQQHLTLLLRSRPDDGELEELSGRCDEALGDPEKAVAAYRAAVAHAPTHIGPYTRLARLLHGPLGRPSEAAQVMDDLVTANDHAAEAYVERAAYRVAVGALDDAERDAARARELSPDDPRVLLTAADLAARRGRADDARTLLNRGLQLHPEDLRLRLALATLELKADRPAAAADCLEEGRKDAKPAPESSELLDLLAEARLRQGRPEAVEALAAEARKNGAAGAADYLEGRLAMHCGRWGAAAKSLEEAIDVSANSEEQAVRALLCAATCYQRLGDGDRRLDAVRRAVASAPASASAGAALGAALLDAGRTDEALDELRGVTQTAEAPEETWALLGRALLLHNQTLPHDRQDWSEVDRALDRAGGSVDAAGLRAAALWARGRFAQAAAVLEESRSEHPDQPGAWTALALDAARRGAPAKAASILADARRRFGDKLELRLAVLQVGAGAEGDDGAKTLKELEKDLDPYTPEERALFLSRLAAAYYRLGRAADGDRLCRALAAQPATDLADRLLLMEAVLSSEDSALVEGVLADVDRLEGDDPTWHDYGRAAWLVARASRGDRSGLPEARTLLTEAARLRPEWSRVALLQGRLAELEGDAAAALDGYRRAFDLGERRPDVALPLAAMLTRRGRWEDADQVFRTLQEQTVLHGALAARAAEVALQAHNGERATGLARSAAPAEDNYAYHIWLGRILAAAGRGPEGEDELRRAVQSPEAGWDATAALAAYLAEHDRSAEAEAAVEALKGKLSERYAALPLAACYEAAGRLDLAEQYYTDAVEKRPDEGKTLIAAATFHLRLDHAAKAELLLRRLLQSGQDLSASDLAWARRERAMLLAADGDGAKYDEALSLLGAGPKPGEDGAAYRRARAFVLGARSDGRAEALRRLEEEAKFGALPRDEQFRLVRLHDAAGEWPQAREQLVSLLVLDRRNPTYLAFLIDGLLLHDGADEAGPWIDKLEGLEPGSTRVKEFRSRRATALAAGPTP